MINSAYSHLTIYRKYSSVFIAQRMLGQLGMDIIVAKISENICSICCTTFN